MTSDSPAAASPSRRRLLAGGAAVAGTAVAVGGLGVAGAAPASAAAATSYPVNPYRATTAPNWRQRHFMNRMGCGYTRYTFRQLVNNGGTDAWFERQISAPRSISESATLKALPSWFPDMNESAATKWNKNSAGTKGGWEYAADFASYSMLRRVYSNRTVLENMVDFWSNHLHVHANSDLGWVYRKSYDDTIRQHALGRFEDLLVAASLHPAMLLYLDNWRSVRNAPNENQGRELLELHTVGRSAGYTEQMVKDSAKLLSGYTVDAFKTWDAFYDPAKHTTGPVQVLGFSSANGAADARTLTVDYLRYLANHPATALNIARKLCRRFVADQPSTAVVNAVAKAFRTSGTDIKATLRALVDHPDFDAGAGKLVRNPVDDWVATCRVLGVQAHKPTQDQAFARHCIWSPQSTVLYHWPRPDGAPLGDAAWSSPTRMLTSFDMHWCLVAGWWPTADVTYKKSGAQWLPKASIRLDQHVDHLCRMLLGKPSDERLLNAVVTATNTHPSTKVTKDHAVATWLHVRVAGLLLDSPDHMRR